MRDTGRGIRDPGYEFRDPGDELQDRVAGTGYESTAGP